jgi:glucose-1-phosphate adenylyltransferase
MLLQPYTGREDSHWYRGTADALYRNLDMITSGKPNMLLVLSGDQVYRMNYGEMIRQHLRNKAKITIALKPTDPRNCHRFGMVQLEGSQVVRFQEKPESTDMRLANLAVYLFDMRWLVERLHEIISEARFDIVWDLLIPAVERNLVSGWIFDGFWEDIGQLDAFYNANRSLLPAASRYLWDAGWPIFTRSEERPPAKFGREATVDNCIIANGCRIHGTVERSILFPGVLVGHHSVVRDSIVFSGAEIHDEAQIERCILDKRVRVGHGSHIGAAEARDAELSGTGTVVRTREGLSVIGRDTAIPAGMTLQTPRMIDSHLEGEAVRRACETGSAERA